jgi:hypothetical protein
MADFTIRLDVRVSPALFRWAMAGLLLSSMAGELASENVQLTTYYPAPSGVYTQMVTTQNTYLARDSGYVDVGTTAPLAAGNGMSIMNGNVGIGTTAPTKLLDVRVALGGTGDEIVWGNITNGILGVLGTNTNYTYWAPTTGAPLNDDIVLTNTGKVGIGTPAPVSKMDVFGNTSFGAYAGVTAAPANGIIVSGRSSFGAAVPPAGPQLYVNGGGGGTVDLQVTGRIQTGDAGNSGGVWLNNTDTEFVGQNGTSAGIWVSGYGWAVNVNNNGRVGLQTANPAYSAMDVGGDGVVLPRQGGCSVVTYGAGVQGCGGGYATMVSGVYANYSASGMDPLTYGALGGAGVSEGGGGGVQSNSIGQGSMVCCPFPAGGAYW